MTGEHKSWADLKAEPGFFSASSEEFLEALEAVAVTPEPDLGEPEWLDAAWVALALPSGTMTTEALSEQVFEELPVEVQEDAVAIIETLYPEEP